MANPGAKSGAGVYQSLARLIPSHEIFIETHLGGGPIIGNKQPVGKNIGVEINPAVADRWRKEFQGRQDVTIVNADAVKYLSDYPFTGKEFVYCAPPYLMETREDGKLSVIEYDRDQHVELLEVINKIPCKVMLTGHWSKLYNDHMRWWNLRSVTTQTVDGSAATQYVWFNYPEPIKPS